MSTKSNKNKKTKTKSKTNAGLTRRQRQSTANYSARIKTDRTKTGGLRTKTSGRDAGSINVTFVTRKNGPAYCQIAGKGYVVTLNGRNVRTVYRVLQKHFEQWS